MRRLPKALGPMALAAALAAGCDTAPPGGGFTNGPAPDMTGEKAATRVDGPARDQTDQGEMKAAGGEASLPTGGGEKDSGTGGKGGNSGEAPAKSATAPPKPVAAPSVAPAPSGSATPEPAPKEGTGANGAAGATKPSGDIKVGTPKGPN